MMVDIEMNMELSHSRGMKKVFPSMNFTNNHAGMLESFVLGTPVIEVARDAKTAKGVWVALMAVDKTYERQEKPTARWIRDSNPI